MAPNGNLDVLGILPDTVVDEVLVRLPLRDAVRTSILSKNWRYKWCSLPELNLYYPIWLTGSFTYCTSHPASIINHILTHHAGPISKFVLHLPYAQQDLPNLQSADMDNLIHFLSRHKLVHLAFRDIPADYRLPASFYTLLDLRHLSLWKGSLLPPPNFKGFQRLNSLLLYNAVIPSKALSSLVSNSPLLEKLFLIHGRDEDDSDVIEINAPMLRTFEFGGRSRFLCFQNVPLLSELIVADSEMDWETFAKLVQPLSTLKLLSLHPVYGYDLAVLECLKVERFSDGTFEHLKEVTLSTIFGTVTHYQLIKLLLAKASVLERMLIQVTEIQIPESDTLLQIQAKVSEFPRASARAAVILKKV